MEYDLTDIVCLSLTMLILRLRLRFWKSLSSHSSAFPSNVGLRKKDPTTQPITGKFDILPWWDHITPCLTYQSDQNKSQTGHTTDFSFRPASTATTSGLVVWPLRTPARDEPSLRTILTRLLKQKESVSFHSSDLDLRNSENINIWYIDILM